jgi:DNA-directed RNA polymerase subunit M/transcription elongation factor TFIIS
MSTISSAKNNLFANSLDYIKHVGIEHFDSTRLPSHKTEFLTENSRDISDDMINYALANIDRATHIIKLAELINDIKIAISIEAGIFEFSLIHATLNNIDKSIISAIYDDKYADVYMNLDETSRLNNTELKNSVLKKLIEPRLVAFLSPKQTHSESWSVILRKVKLRMETESNMATSDIYKCYKCGERKCKVTELQLRGADESGTLFITCLSCYNTFLK